MSKSRKARRNAVPPAATATGRRLPGSAAVLVAVAVVAAGGYWWGTGRRVESPAAAVPPAVTPATSIPAPAQGAEAPPAFQKLKGRWVRTDGGYVVEIRNVEASGKVDAAYFNPRAIHVARAEASQAAEAVKLFIELRDVNYPGSTYTLSLSPDAGQLLGTYYQAAVRETYDVVFVRQ
jgi:hypothetical protein